MSKTLSLTSPARQQRFAELVGVSQPAIAAHVKSGVLSGNGTYEVWMVEYCDQLRKEASGRGGGKQAELTEARIDESRENTATKRQARLKEAKQLLIYDDVARILLELPRLFRTEVTMVGEEIHHSISNKYDIQLEESDVIEPLRSTLGHVANRAKQLEEAFGSDTE